MNQSLRTFNGLIEKFLEISGLIINQNKTELMVFGNTEQLTNIATEHGFTVKESSIHLGMIIECNGISNINWDNKSRESKKHGDSH